MVVSEIHYKVTTTPEQLSETILSYYNNSETVDKYPETRLLGATVRKYIYLSASGAQRVFRVASIVCLFGGHPAIWTNCGLAILRATYFLFGSLVYYNRLSD